MANSEPRLHEPWLIAAWPGMGSVAIGAAGYLLEKLGGRPIRSIERRECFDVTAVAIEGGLVRRPALPKNTFYAVPARGGSERDLLVFIGEAQPTHKGYEFCHEILDVALSHGVRRVVTFAAMATPVHPSAEARVFGVVTERALLPALARHEVKVLGEGQISGLNGVLLAAAAERGIEGMCLLGELPFFAVQVPNPKASLAVLEAFSRISGTSIDFDEIREQARIVERGLTEVLERASAAQREAGESQESEEGGEEPSFTIPEVAAHAREIEDEEKQRNAPSAATLARIEELFRRAREDKSQAIQLKAELDRLGLFKHYEDRFLDLFKKDQHG